MGWFFLASFHNSRSLHPSHRSQATMAQNFLRSENEVDDKVEIRLVEGMLSAANVAGAFEGP